MEDAAALVRGASRPMIVSGGGTIYSEATEALRRFAERTGIPVAETQAGKGSHALRSSARPRGRGRHGYLRRQPRGPRGRPRHRGRHPVERLHHGLEDRLPEPERALRQHQRRRLRRPQARRARPGRRRPRHAGGPRRGPGRITRSRRSTGSRARRANAEWDREVERLYTLEHGPLPAQSEVLGAVNSFSGPEDVVVCAAGSMPGDLAQALEDARPQGLPRRVRLLDNGIRDRRGPGHQDGRPASARST